MAHRSDRAVRDSWRLAYDLLGDNALFNRHSLAVLLTCAGLMAGTTSITQAQDDAGGTPTASELYKQGISAFDAGEREKARSLFRQVDPMQLPADQRVKMYEAMQQLDAANESQPVATTPSTPESDATADADASAGFPEDTPTTDAAAGADTQQSMETEVADSGVSASNAANESAAAKININADDPMSDPMSDPSDSMVVGVEPELDDAAGGVQPVVINPRSDLLESVRVAQAQKLAIEARQAANAGNFTLAQERYQQAMALDPENAKLDAEAQAVAAKATQVQAPQGLLDQNQNTRRVAVEKTLAEYNQAMDKARTEVNTGNYSAAQDAVANAKTILDRNQRLLPNDEYLAKRKAAESLASDIDQRRQVAEAQEAARIAIERDRDQARSQAEAEMRQQEEVDELLTRARELQRDQRYDEALELVNQALFLDPTNIAAQGMRDIIQDVRALVAQSNYIRDRDVNIANQSAQNMEATIPYDELITYPADWPQLTELRLSSQDVTGGESEANRRVSQKLREPVPVNFESNRLVNVIDYFRNTTGVNFFVNWPALEAAGIEKDTPVSLLLTNVPADEALRLVLTQVSALNEFDPVTYSIIEGIVTISTERDLNKTSELRLYDIRDLLVQIPSFTDAPEFDLSEALSNTNSGGGGGGGGGSGSGLFGDTDEDEEQEFPTREELVESIITLMQDLIGRQEDWAAYGGDVSSVRELNGQLIVQSTPQNHREIIDLLAQIRETRATQISVESRFLVIDESFLEEVGVDLDFQIDNLGAGFGPIKVAQDSYSLARRGSTAITPGRFQTSDPFFDSNNPIPGPGVFNPLGEETGFLPRTGRSLNLGLSYIDDFQVNLLIQATQANQRSITLTAPRVTFFNGQRAYVTVVEQVAFVSDLEPIPDAIGFDVTVSITQQGAVLDVEGTISSDRRYVTLTLRPSIADFRQFPFRTLPVTGAIGGGDDAEPIIFGGEIELPELRLTSVRATVSIPDRGTLLLGGQRIVGEVEIEAGVPVLSKVPVVNRLFTNSSIVKDERTLLILVKPTIIIQTEEEENLFPGLLQNPEEYNVGQTF